MYFEALLHRYFKNLRSLNVLWDTSKYFIHTFRYLEVLLATLKYFHDLEELEVLWWYFGVLEGTS